MLLDSSDKGTVVATPITTHRRVTSPSATAPPESGGPRKRRRRGRLFWSFAFLCSLAAVIFAWQWYVTANHISAAVVPTPSALWKAFWTDATDGTYASNMVITGEEVLIGFVAGGALGALLGLVISEFNWVRKIIYPYVIATQSVPKIALAPLFLIWFGFGLESKVLLAVTVTFFPVLINTLSGLDQVEEGQMELMRALCAKRWRVFLRVKLPTAVPSIFAGLEIAIVLSVIAAVVAEFIGATEGLGYLILYYNTNLNVAAEFAALLVLSLAGYILHWVITFIGRRVVFWRRVQDHSLGL